jgi:hypothetical protein
LVILAPLVANASLKRTNASAPWLRSGLFIPRYFINVDFAPIYLFLTIDAVGRPWHSSQAFRQDIFFARQTDAICAVHNPLKRKANQSERLRIPAEITDGEFAHQLDFIECVRRPSRL